MYVAEHNEIVRFVLSDGGPITGVFWIGQILVGSALPMVLFLHPRLSEMRWAMIAAVLVVVGAVSQLYVIIIGGQAVPMDLFPGKSESSSFYDGVIASYSPSVPELLLGLGGIAVSLFVIVVALRVLPFLPAARALETSPQ
jgi:molybdopterin-containing oxidoreductase family membrane subunit